MSSREAIIGDFLAETDRMFKQGLINVEDLPKQYVEIMGIPKITQEDSKRKNNMKPHEQLPLSPNCGPASLLIIYKAFGIEYEEQQLAQEIGTTKDGTDWMMMIDHASNKGFEVAFYRNATWDALIRENGKPAIIGYYTKREKPGPHFSVIKDVTNIGITLFDPEFGDEFTYTKRYFEDIWHDEEGKREFMTIQKEVL